MASSGVRSSLLRWRRPAVLIALAVGLVVVSVVAAGYRPGAPPVVRSAGGRTAPAFAVSDLRDESRTISLEQLSGHPIVLNFWASWCVPCRKELSAFEAVHRRAGSRVTLLGMNNQDTRRDALGLLRQAKVSYPSGFDPSGRVGEAYLLRGMPTTVFISTEGTILATRTGQMSESELADAILDLFAVPLPGS